MLWMRWLVCICVAAMGLLALTASEQEDTGQTEGLGAGPACCEGTGIRWYVTRFVNGEVVDRTWLVPAEGRWVYSAFPSRSKKGGLGYLAALIEPFKEGGEYPQMKAGQRYYNGRIPGVGEILAQQFEEGETWVFNYRGYVITDSEGYILGGTIRMQATSKLRKRWKQDWDGELGNGAWGVVSCTGQVDYVFGSSGNQREELQPEEQGMDFVEVPIPGNEGHFLGRCHEVGEIWDVTCNGHTYRAVVTKKDPKAYPLDQLPSARETPAAE